MDLVKVFHIEVFRQVALHGGDLQIKKFLLLVAAGILMFWGLGQ